MTGESGHLAWHYPPLKSCYVLNSLAFPFPKIWCKDGYPGVWDRSRLCLDTQHILPFYAYPLAPNPVRPAFTSTTVASVNSTARRWSSITQIPLSQCLILMGDTPLDPVV